jgi:hypothetical protein
MSTKAIPNLPIVSAKCEDFAQKLIKLMALEGMPIRFSTAC